MEITDGRLDQLANDPEMSNISHEVRECMRELITLRAENRGLKAPLNSNEWDLFCRPKYANLRSLVDRVIAARAR